MSQMSTVPVFKCKYCGRPVYVTSLRTATPDPEGELLYKLMANLKKIAMCPKCQKKYNYMASQGRSEEFIKGAQSPIVIVSK